jgi:beta-glucosidase-like glycosyl hydrolase
MKTGKLRSMGGTGKTAMQHALDAAENMDGRAYAAAVKDFGENEDCSPVDAVQHNPRCIDIARRFGKTPAQVSRDINRQYIASYQPLDAGMLDLLDDEDE